MNSLIPLLLLFAQQTVVDLPPGSTVEIEITGPGSVTVTVPDEPPCEGEDCEPPPCEGEECEPPPCDPHEEGCEPPPCDPEVEECPCEGEDCEPDPCDENPELCEPPDGDLDHLGYFTPPRYPGNAPRYSFSMGGLDYDKGCFGLTDPSPLDGAPGCFVAVGHPGFRPRQIGVFDGVPPGSSSVEVLGIVDPTLRANGSSIYQDIRTQIHSQVKGIGGVVALSDGRYVVSAGYDWYNTGEAKFKGFTAGRLGTETATGPFLFQCGDGSPILCHTNQIQRYFGKTSQTFADAAFGGGEWCLAGFNRWPGSKVTQSQGTSVYAFRCSDSFSGFPSISAIPLVHYPKAPSAIDTTWPALEWDDWSPRHRVNDIAWGEFDGEEVLFVAAQKGGQSWWYGLGRDPWATFQNQGDNPHRNQCMWNAGNPIWRNDHGKAGQPCGAQFAAWGDPILPRGTMDTCEQNKTYHTQPSDDVGSFVAIYPASGLLASARASQQAGTDFEHLDDLPHFRILDTPPEMLKTRCGDSFKGIAYGDGKLYVMEVMGETVAIHVYE